MKKRMAALLLVAALLCALLPQITLLAHADYSGICGNNLTWAFDPETRTLTIEGSGEMVDRNIPWHWFDYLIWDISLPEGLTHIGDWAFYRCDSLTSVTIPSSVTSIGEKAFSECDRLTSVTIPEGMTSIGDQAFSWCSSLPSVTIPASVTDIGDRAFDWCESLTQIIVAEDNPAYSSDSDGVLFSKDKTLLIGYLCGRSGAYIIPDSVTGIGDHAFSDCRSLTSVTIPDSVTSIGEGAFYNCNSLTSVTIPDSVTEIGDRAFGYLSNFSGDYRMEGFTVYGYADSAAQTYAKENKFNFVRLDENGKPILPAFSDVPAGAFYAKAVNWAVAQGVTNGTSATAFSPNATCTRAQVVTFLWRAKGQPKPTGSENPFTDVPAGQYYTDAVLWAVENKITSGTGATTFSPNAGCTRAQVVTFLWRAEGEPTPTDSTNPFTDVPAGAYYYDAVLWAVAQGITNGTSATAFSPNATCTRGQIVTFLYRDLAE